MIGKILISIFVICTLIVVAGLYACLVVGKEADEKIKKLMCAGDASDAASGEVKQ